MLSQQGGIVAAAARISPPPLPVSPPDAWTPAEGILELCMHCGDDCPLEDLLQAEVWLCSVCTARPSHLEREILEKTRIAFAKVELDPYAAENHELLDVLVRRGREKAAQAKADIAVKRMRSAEGWMATYGRQLTQAKLRVRELEMRLHMVAGGCQALGKKAPEIRVEAEAIATIATHCLGL